MHDAEQSADPIWVLHLGYCKRGIVLGSRVRGRWKWRRTEKLVAFPFACGIRKEWKPLCDLLTEQQHEALTRA